MSDVLADYQAVDGFICPAEFWPALGYTGDARYVAIWWEPCGDEASWSDGRMSEIGADWAAYLELMDYNFAPLSIERCKLGSSESEATHKLVVDRETERGWLVPVSSAERVLQAQYPVEDTAVDGVGVVEFEELLTMIERLPSAVPMMSMETIETAMAEGAARLAALEAALAERPRRW